jgi:hypothetical protein
LYTLAFAFQLRKNQGKTLSQGIQKGARIISAERDSFNRLGYRLAMAWDGLLAGLRFRVR